ncbi:pre-mRNA-splicing factor ISY1 homolog [Ostrea edulis]|uniref:pre-mRNA-splicing factor ISY1 homolog n=1 Tax=Ostrea edulis TaxID=37623 RepID=UPI0024AECAAE|nr:pre-mRNA-splicing factor ISY1 homolog [Ostrea edulis]XP_048740409.2 pre-mRNA-splicing factor ISY1 homolog [Ostrea edulis]XP_056001860.1 pre-mRNA-splicing factor ISY1 homolog [Ostrea edulis]
MSKEQERPYPATECEDLVRAKEWRQEIIDEISRKMEQIQNAGLGEFKLIDLNDQINILLLEKGEWDEQIQILGGPDYKEIGPKMMKLEWKEVPGNERYKYFGATKDLPGIRELFQQEGSPPCKKRRLRLFIDADYCGSPPPLKKRLLRLTNDVDDDCHGCKDEGIGLIVAKEEEMEERVPEDTAIEEEEEVEEVEKIEEDVEEEEEVDVVEEEKPYYTRMHAFVNILCVWTTPFTLRDLGLSILVS